jgi:hypothetical protein
VRRYLVDELEIPRTIESRLPPISIKRIAKDFHVSDREASLCLSRLTRNGWVTIRPVTTKGVYGFDWYITKQAIADELKRRKWLRDGVRVALPSVTSNVSTLVGARVDVDDPSISKAFKRQTYLLPLLALLFLQRRWRLGEIVTALGRLSSASLITKLRTSRASRPHRTLVNTALKFLHSRVLTLYRSWTADGLEYEVVGNPARLSVMFGTGKQVGNNTEISFWRRFGEVALQWEGRSNTLLETTRDMESLVRDLRALGGEPSTDAIVSLMNKYPRFF